jgi:hypothetical protein
MLLSVLHLLSVYMVRHSTTAPLHILKRRTLMLSPLAAAAAAACTCVAPLRAALQCKAFPGCLGPEVAEAAAAAQGRSGVVFSVGMALDVSQRDRLVTLLREQVRGMR